MESVYEIQSRINDLNLLLDQLQYKQIEHLREHIMRTFYNPHVSKHVIEMCQSFASKMYHNRDEESGDIAEFRMIHIATWHHKYPWFIPKLIDCGLLTEKHSIHFDSYYHVPLTDHHAFVLKVRAEGNYHNPYTGEVLTQGRFEGYVQTKYSFTPLVYEIVKQFKV